MALSKLAANSFDLTDNYALTGTVTGVTSTQKLFLIKNIDASSSSTVSFVDGASDVVLDNTYKTYLFKFINIHRSVDGANFLFNGSTDGGSNYNVTKTTSYFGAVHREDDASASLFYSTGNDLAQSTSFQNLGIGAGNDSDQSGVGEMWLFNPSSTTFVKHFMTNGNQSQSTPGSLNVRVAGYMNTTSAINAIQFKPSSGNIDSGRIALYGIK